MIIKNELPPKFDPEPSLRKAVDLLRKANVSPYALIGRVALWCYLEEEQHQYTKDVDFAVPLSFTEDLEKILKDEKLNYLQLQIGGFGIRDEKYQIDLIDRRFNRMDLLFKEAIENTEQFITLDDEKIPVVEIEYLIAIKMISGEPKHDFDVKALLKINELNYQKTKSITHQYLGPGTAERLDYFAREEGILPKRGPYKYGE